ncbi:MAG TPA: hypothetical protein VLH75_01945 [Longimicrobiales bacterium]|nr:hypothetical protein [Longimicrobiales bacterium]
MTRTKMAMLLGLAVLGSAACAERTPTSVDPDLFPGKPTSVAVSLSWEEFGSNLKVFGGFGDVSELGEGMVARSFGGVLDARTLVRFTVLPTSASVTDATGTSVTDTLLSLQGGRVVAFMDTTGSVVSGPVTLELGALRQRWHRASATWSMAVDTAGEQRPWTEPGAGPLERLATAVWDPSRGDSVVFFLDSTAVKLFRDTSEVARGALLGMLTPGARLKVDDVALRATVRASRADTLLELTSSWEALTFLYTPEAGAPGDGLRVGGVPAWRTTLDLAVPARLTGPPSLCAAVGCPVELTSGRVNYAALVLSSRSTDPAFRPSDSLGVDVRAVYDPSALPKSPLGAALIGGYGKMMGPGLFGAGEGADVEIPITNFVRAILQADTVAGFPPPHSLAILSAVEPSSLAFASFWGVGTPRAPRLKLIVTTSHSVELP